MKFIVEAERMETWRIEVEADSIDEAKAKVWAAEIDPSVWVAPGLPPGFRVLDRRPTSSLSGFRIRVVRPIEGGA